MVIFTPHKPFSSIFAHFVLTLVKIQLLRYLSSFVLLLLNSCCLAIFSPLKRPRVRSPWPPTLGRRVIFSNIYFMHSCSPQGGPSESCLGLIPRSEGALSCLDTVHIADQNLVDVSVKDLAVVNTVVANNDEILDLVHMGQHASHLVVACNSPALRLYEVQIFSLLFLV